MTSEQLAQLKQCLFDLKQELTQQAANAQEQAKPVELDQSKVGRLSRMDALQTQQMAMESERRRQMQLVKIEGAFKRIENDDYGYCLNCDEEIDIRRLKIDPTNTHCIECAEKLS